MDTLDFTGATVRVPYVGTGVITDSRRFVEGTMYAVDIPINGRNMRVWRSYDQLKVVALRVVSVAPPCPKKADSSVSDGQTVSVPVDSALTPEIVEATITKPEVVDKRNDTQRDNGPDRIQVNVKHLAERDVIELIRLDATRPYDCERWHIVSITPHVALEPRRARVAVFRGIQGPGVSNWTSCGFCDVTFPTLTVAPFWTVCGGSKLDAARRDPALLERTNMMTLPRWKGGGDVMRLPMLEAENYGVIAA